MGSLMFVDDKSIHPMIVTDKTKRMLELNQMIHGESKDWVYHLNHILLTEQYAFILMDMLKSKISPSSLSISALAHDLLKEHSKENILEHIFSQSSEFTDLNLYVRSHLSTLACFGLDDYFNTSMSPHASATGIYLYNTTELVDQSILYPIFFHACPIMPVYLELKPEIQEAVDIIMLADKLSSNYLKINLLGKRVPCDLDQVVFGTSGNEFNYSIGLAIARIIGQGHSNEPFGLEATIYYYDRVREVCPFMPKKFSLKMLGGMKKWPKRESQVLQTLPTRLERYF